MKDTSWKINLDEVVDEFDSRHDKRRIKLHWGDEDTNSTPGSMRRVWALRHQTGVHYSAAEWTKIKVAVRNIVAPAPSHSYQ